MALLFITSVSSSPLLSFDRSKFSSPERRAQLKSLPADKKNIAFTYYWVSFEKDYKSQTKNRVALKTCDNRVLARVDPKFAEAIRLEGSGITNDGNLYNLGGEYQFIYNNREFFFK